MVIDNLKQNEPIAYQMLGNALKNNKVAHSYLFSGEYNPLKIEKGRSQLNADSIPNSNNIIDIRNNQEYYVNKIELLKHKIENNEYNGKGCITIRKRKVIQQIKEFQYKISGSKIKNEDYTVKSVITVFNNGERYYEHKLSK